MSQITAPYSFEPGTLAKASEVNANFSALYNESNNQDSRITANETQINNLSANKANVNGDQTKVFRCASPDSDNASINKGYMFSKILNSNKLINGFKISVDTTDNKVLIISPGVCYMARNSSVYYDEYKLEITSIQPYDTTTLNSSTKYYLFAWTDDAGVTTNIEANSSQNPSGWTSRRYREIGNFYKDKDGVVQNVAYYGIQTDSNKSIYASFPDYNESYTDVIVKKGATNETWTAPSDGWLMTNSPSAISINGDNTTSNVYNIIALLKAGDVIHSTSTTATTYKFLPCIGGV